MKAGILMPDNLHAMKQLIIFAALFFTSSCLNAQTSNLGLATSLNITPANEDTAQYAVLYVYSPPGRQNVRTTIFIDSLAICGLTTNSKAEIRLYKEGMTEVSFKGSSWEGFFRNDLYAPLEYKIVNTNINVEFGKEYYLECKMPDHGFRFNPIIQLMSTDKGKPDWQQIMPDSFYFPNSVLIEIPNLKEPLSLCEKVQDVWNKLYQEHPNIKAKFDSVPPMRAYFFNVEFTIDTLGKLTVNNADKYSADPNTDLICFRAFQNLLEKTQWIPSYETKKNTRTPFSTTGWAFFTIASEGFESVEMGDGTKYREIFYKCNLGK